MAIYYKFKSAKAFDSINIEGQFISVVTLKERIFESKHLGRGNDFDLVISNAQSNEEYVDEAAMIPKNTSVLIRRVPGQPRKRIVTEPNESKVVHNKAEEVPPLPSSMLIGDSSTTMKYPEESDWDEFGNDLYAIPEIPALPAIPVIDVTPSSKIDEENNFKALIETSALDWSCQGQDGYGGGRGYGRGVGGRMMPGRGFGRGGFERKTPPVGYICHRCKTPGHFIQHCPTNGDPNYDVRKVKPPTGIPKSMLMTTSDGSYALPSGAVAVLKPNEAAFEKEIEGIPSARPVNDLPPEFRCPLCKEVMKDAVLTSKCCFRSFCDKCIRDCIIGKLMCVCGATNTLADDLLPNTTLRETISRILESTTSSTENFGSMLQVQDMESSRPMPSKDRSPTLSVASRDERKSTPTHHSSYVMVVDGKQVDTLSEGKAVNGMVHALENKTIINTGQSKATHDTKEPVSPESAPVTEEGRERLLGGEQGKKKKKKKTRLPGSDVDMQWRGFHDLGSEAYGGVPLASSAHNPYWGGGMPMGMDGFMGPFGGTMPYMAYAAPGPFDVPFGGMLPADPFAVQGFMMPPFPPRDLSELSFNSMNMNRGPPMNRGKFEAMKADVRRKHEFERERVNGREHSRDSRGNGKDVGTGGADVSSMKAKPRQMSQAERLDRSERASHSHSHSHPQSQVDDRRRRSSQRSPSPLPRPPVKRRSLERDDGSRKEDERASATEREHKGSVFARISLPESERQAKKRVSSSSDSASVSGAAKDHHHHHGQRDESAATRQRSALSNGYRRGSSYDNESSEEEEDDDDEYHFKRRPSSSSSRREIGVREQDRGGHERVGSRRR